MKCKRTFCAALAAALLFLCACQKDGAQSVSETAVPSAVSENAETTLAAAPESTAAGELVLPEKELEEVIDVIDKSNILKD